MRVLIGMREALSDPKILGRALVGASWDGWKALLLACAGEVLTDQEREHFTRLTGREREPGDGVLSEVFLCIGGRRGGKSRAMATFCTWLSSCVSWEDCLSLGERGRCVIICPSMDQSRLVLDYVKALFHDNQLLSTLIENELQDELHLKRRIIFEVQAASAAHSRGRTAIAVFCDESAFLKSGDAVNSDEDVVTALRPSLLSTGGPLLLTSSPAGAEGLVYQLFKRHYGPQGDARCIVAKGSTIDLNPVARRSIIDKAYEQDSEAASAEYGGEFRSPQTAFVTRELIEKCIDSGINERPVLPGVQYLAYCDSASGTGRDSFALSIGHRSRDKDRDVVVIDLIREQRPPFNPLTTIEAVCEHLRRFGIREISGDQYGKPHISTFARHGITYRIPRDDTSAVYLHSLPSWVSGSVVMLDQNPRAVDQLCSLKRQIGQAGREFVRHPNNAHAHDDLAVVICGVIYLCTPIEHQAAGSWEIPGVVTVPRVVGGVPGSATPEDLAHAYLTRSRGGNSGGSGGSVLW
jgi:hypothetical protein